MRIAFFDSGLGGITVLREAIKLLPKEDFIYFADTLHVPYGTKSKSLVKEYIFDAVAKIEKQGIKALVIACNTATSIAVDDLRSCFPFPIIGIEPAVKPAVEKNKHTNNRVLVLATPLTLKESKFQDLVSKIDDVHIVDSLPLPELVTFCEELQFDENVIVPYLADKLSTFDLSRYGTVVLGCTHFPFYRQHLGKLLPEHVDIIDGSLGTAKRLKQLLAENDMLQQTGNADVTYLSSRESSDELIKMKRAMDYLCSQQ